VLTDALPFLDALESDPGDDSLWLVFSDWLEEHAVPRLPERVRDAVGSATWGRFRLEEFRALDVPSRRLVACDILERILPIFEARYPDEVGVRHYLDRLRGPTQPSQHTHFNSAQHTAYSDSLRDPNRFAAAFDVLGLIADTVSGRSYHGAILRAHRPVIVDRFGPEARYDPNRPYRPEWAVVREVEHRWQVARLLRYRFGLDRKTT
jgi:uncharacterized protein (TIGR02996 family)